jgi:hypothetical protein
LSAPGAQAIAAWNRALAAEPGNGEVLLSMGVSYTNELDQGRALGFLRRWLERRLAQGGVRARARLRRGSAPSDMNRMACTLALRRLFAVASCCDGEKTRDRSPMCKVCSPS